VLYNLDRRGRSRVTLRIAAHEGWHQYAESVFKDCLPTWLDEGIGTWMEGFRIRNGEIKFMPASNWDRLSTLRKIVSADKLDSLNSLITSEPSALLLTGRSALLSYYAQLWALTSFIVEFENGKYLPGLHAVLASALEGTLQEPNGGWMFAFTDNPTQIEREYKEWVVQYVRPGSTWRLLVLFLIRTVSGFVHAKQYNCLKVKSVNVFYTWVILKRMKFLMNSHVTMSVWCLAIAILLLVFRTMQSRLILMFNIQPEQ